MIAIIAKAETFGFTMSKKQRVSENFEYILPVCIVPLGTMLLVSSYRQDAAKRQTAGIKFTHRPKIRFFAPQG